MPSSTRPFVWIVLGLLIAAQAGQADAQRKPERIDASGTLGLIRPPMVMVVTSDNKNLPFRIGP